LDKNIEENFEIIEKIKNNPINYWDLYEKIITTCQNTKMTRNRKVDVFGMFIPDDRIEYPLGEYKGKLTDNPKNIDFKYYFDNENRIILTERFWGENHTLSDLIFYFYNPMNTERVLFRTKDSEVGNVGYLEYDKEHNLIKYLDADVRKDIKTRAYFESLYSYTSDSYTIKFTAYLYSKTNPYCKTHFVTRKLNSNL